MSRANQNGLRRFLPLILALLSPCGGCRDATEARGRTVIEFWSGWAGAEGRAFQAVVDRFNREHPSLFVRNVNGVQNDTKTIRAITAGVPPDAVSLWNNRYLGPLAANGALLPLDARLRSPRRQDARAGAARRAASPGARGAIPGREITPRHRGGEAAPGRSSGSGRAGVLPITRRSRSAWSRSCCCCWAFSR